MSKGSANSGNTLAGSLAGSVSINSIIGRTRRRSSAAASCSKRDRARVRRSSKPRIVPRSFDFARSVAGDREGWQFRQFEGRVDQRGHRGRRSCWACCTDHRGRVNCHGCPTRSADSTSRRRDCRRSSRLTVAGAVAGAMGKQGSSGPAGAGAGSGSVNQIHSDVVAAIRNSSVLVPGQLQVVATNGAEIIAGAGALSVSIAQGGSGSARPPASVAGAFAINSIGSDGNPSLTVAEIAGIRHHDRWIDHRAGGDDGRSLRDRDRRSRQCEHVDGRVVDRRRPGRFDRTQRDSQSHARSGAWLEHADDSTQRGRCREREGHRRLVDSIARRCRRAHDCPELRRQRCVGTRSASRSRSTTSPMSCSPRSKTPPLLPMGRSRSVPTVGP